jgi:hypothetical protein
MASLLDDLLDQIRDALISGNLAVLAGLDIQLAAEASKLPPLDSVTARRLQTKAERNARLLQAAARGLRAARDRMTEIASAPGLATYDAKGRKAAIASPSQALGRF